MDDDLAGLKTLFHFTLFDGLKSRFIIGAVHPKVQAKRGSELMMLPSEKEAERYMALALQEAAKAAAIDEVPVGAVIVKEGRVIAKAYNLREKKGDATAHAELLALQKACKKLGGWRLEGAELYVTLEPCPMCAGAILQARIKRLIFGAYDPKAGATGSLINLLDDNRFNHQVEVKGGVCAEESAKLLKEFFARKRGKEREY